MSAELKRFSAGISSEQDHILSQILPHGTRNQLVKVFINGVIDMHANGGQMALGLILTDAISIDQIFDVGVKVSKDKKIQSLKAKIAELQKS